jgi:murein DD-endopeptidase MepM/ murein hydrolase activator NlpD
MLLIVIVVVALGMEGRASSSPRVHLLSRVIPQGELAIVKVELKEGETPFVRWLDREIYLVPGDRRTSWYGLLAADMNTQPGRYPLLIKVLPGSWEETLEVTVVKKDRGVRRLKLPKAMVDLDADTMERVKTEAAVMAEVLSSPPAAPLWRGRFLAPVAGEIVGPFGQASVINDSPRSAHSGVDLKASLGTPVLAMNHGKVVLVADQFFSGLSVVIDHGGAIQSMYFHLDKILVNRDDQVKKGQVIGLVGSTGRASGPHLHLGVRVNSARVDPLHLTVVSETMEQP